MQDDAVNKILTIWGNRKHNNYAGIIANNTRINGANIITHFPEGIEEASVQEFVYKYKCHGDKFTILRSDIIDLIKDAPEYEDEKLVGESYYWIQIPNNLPFILMDEPIGVVDYQDNGYSKSAYLNVFNNPKGFQQYYLKFIECSAFLKPRIKGHLGYISCSIMLRDQGFIRKSPKKVETTILIPAGLVWYIYINNRKNRLEKQTKKHIKYEAK